MLSLLKTLIGPPAPVEPASNYYKDLSYVLMLGCSQPLLGAIAIIITKQVLGGSNQLIALIQAGSMSGLLLSLIYSRYFVSKRAERDYALPQLLAWLAIIGCAMTANPLIFAGLTFLALALLHVSSPSQGLLYQRIYRAKDRGSIVGRVKQWQLLVAVSLSWLLGQMIEAASSSYKPTYYMVGLFGLLACLLFMTIKSNAGEAELHEAPSFRRYGQILLSDKGFFRFMAFQFLLGIANISGIAVFQVFINDSQHLGLDPASAALVAGVLPPLAMFFSIRLWGKIFDRVSIIQFRVMTSVTMGLGFLLYPIFGFWGAFAGSLVWGVGRGGGQLAWSLGVLDFAPKGQASHYLSIHTFLTGVRGVVAPFIGIWLLESHLKAEYIFQLVALLIFISATLTWLLVPQPKHRH